MKYFYTIVFLLASFHAFAQHRFNPVNFEPDSAAHSYFIAIDNSYPNNSWQIGGLHKANFTTAINGTQSIVTDTSNICTPGDTSVFYLKIPFFMYTPRYGMMIDLNFVHQLDIDSGSIARIEELFMYNNDSVWINLTDTPYLYDQWKNVYMSGYDTTIFTQSTNGKDTAHLSFWSIENILMGQGYTRHQTHSNDTVLFRFTYISNDTSLTKDGWMIDDIYVNYHWSSVKDVGLGQVSVYPNPGDGHVVIRTTDANRGGAVTVSDMQGRVVYHSSNLPVDGSIDLSSLPSGMYVLKYATERGESYNRITILKP